VVELLTNQPSRIHGASEGTEMAAGIGSKLLTKTMEKNLFLDINILLYLSEL
jgi:hypothetical protein